MMEHIQAFIFDLDGVITDTAEYHYLAWKALAEELEIPFDMTFNEKLKGVSRMDSLELILEHGGKQDAYTLEEKEELATKKNDHYKTLIANITENDLLPGIHSFLQEIKEKGLKLGLASASKNAFTVMDALGLTSTFDYIVDSSKIKNGKPDPEIFLTAAKALDVEPTHCIGVEDAASGVKAIKGAGMFAVGVGDDKTLAEADLVVSTTEQLKLDTILNRYVQI